MIPRSGTKPNSVRSRLEQMGQQFSSHQHSAEPTVRTTIVLDAMGSDRSPEPEIAGAIMACRLLPVRVLLVGPEEVIRPALDAKLRGEELPIEIVHASEWISMDDKAAASVRSKKDSSMRVGLKLVREKKAAGFLTAGNTGAAMATAKMVLGALAGVDRPALAAVLPTITGSPCILLDVGANVDCDAQNLQQFAVMGNMYSRLVLRCGMPRVGLLSIGEEETKGNALTAQTFPLMKELKLDFMGNVEGRDIFNGRADVVVCDGFVGNVALKTSEGLAKLVRELLRESLTSTVTAKVGAMLSKQAFNEFKKRLDQSEYGGAPLLGVRGVCIVGHGSSNERAIMNGVRVAAEFAQTDINHQIEEQLAALAGRPPQTEPGVPAQAI